MNCHECTIDGVEAPAVAICRFCMVGLCKHHLVESFRGTTIPQYSCNHRPAAPARMAVTPTAASGSQGDSLPVAGPLTAGRRN